MLPIDKQYRHAHVKSITSSPSGRGLRVLAAVPGSSARRTVLRPNCWRWDERRRVGRGGVGEGEGDTTEMTQCLLQSAAARPRLLRRPLLRCRSPALGAAPPAAAAVFKGGRWLERGGGLTRRTQSELSKPPSHCCACCPAFSAVITL